MTPTEIVGYLAVGLSVVSQFPQAIKIYRTRDTHSISLVMYFVIVVAVSLWLVYGILLDDAPLFWANALSLFPITYIFLVKLYNTLTRKDKWGI